MLGNSAFVMLVVGQMERSVAFYRDVLGLQVTNQSSEWTELEAGGVRIGLHATTEKLHVKPNESYGIGFYVDDIQRVHEELKARNVHFIRPPRQENFGLLAVFSDPDGYHIQLCQMAVQSRAA
jgi:predicted enzyme related to lactoylglutathione lyase